MSDICVECGNSVKFGSGRFVNRIPVFDDRETNVACGRPFPDGEWLCAECEEKWDKENPSYEEEMKKSAKVPDERNMTLDTRS